MQEKWRFFKKNRPLYAGIGIFREGGTAGKQKKRREEKREGAPQVNRLDPAKRYTRIGRVAGGAASIRRTGRGKKNPRGTRVRAANPPMPRAHRRRRENRSRNSRAQDNVDAHRTTRGRIARGTREHRTKRGGRALDKAGRAGQRRFRDNDIRHIEISKEGKKKEEKNSAE